MKIAHVAYHVSNMEQSLDFYVNKLGLEHSFSIENNEGKPWIEYLKITDGQFIELFYGGSEPNEHPHAYAHLCLEVEDIHECAGFLKEKGLTLDVEPVQGKDLNWQCWVSDPDKNPIEFMQISEASPQAKA